MGVRERLRKAAPPALCAYFGLIGGLGLAVFELPPYGTAVKAKMAFADLRLHWNGYFGVEPVRQLRPRRHEGNGVVKADLERASPGVTLLVGLFGGELGVQLVGLDGSVLHRWPANFFDAVPEERKAYPFQALLHGSHLYPNGDLIANLEYDGMLRVDACGDTVWQNEEDTHHSVSVDDDGNVWAARLATLYDEPRMSEAPFAFDEIVRFDPDTGEALEVIDLVEILTRDGMEGVALANAIAHGDVMHVNDVEVLSAEMAGAFPLFEAGDLMLNSREFNQIWVIDGETHAIKWWRAGPMHRQHDPDFQADGTITVLDNRSSDTSPEPGPDLGRMGGSRILSLDPQSYEHEVVYEGDERNDFYTDRRGKHQVLPGGNVLITETDAGRAFEVTPQGDVVWSYVNGHDENRVAWIMEATRYPASYGDSVPTECG